MPPTATAIAAAIVIIFMDVLACSPAGVLPRTMTRGAHAAKRIMLSHRCEWRQACRKFGAAASLARDRLTPRDRHGAERNKHAMVGVGVRQRARCGRRRERARASLP